MMVAKLPQRILSQARLLLPMAFALIVGCTVEQRDRIPEALELRQEAVFGQLDGEPHQVFGRIADVSAGPGDTFVLLDEQGRSVWWMDQTGEPVAGLTERGSGPGELERPRALDVSEAGRVTVFDPGRGHYGVYDLTSGIFQFTGSFEAVGQEAALGRHMCSVGDRLYLRSVDGGDLIQEIGPNGDIVRSFGSVEPASPETFGPAAPMVEAIRNSGHLGCFPDLGIVVSVGRYLPHVRAFSLEGGEVWEVEPTGLRLIGFGPGVGVNYVVDGESGSHLGESLVRWDDETLVVQYSVSWPDSVPAQDRGRDHFAVDSRLIDIRSGREIARTDQLPFIVDSKSDRFFGFRNLPVPQVLMFRKDPP